MGRCRGVLAVALAACSSPPASGPAIKFLHTFGADETEVFNATMAERGLAVESSLVPFARGQQVISEILRAGASCPDLIRIDATWLAGLVDRDLLLPVPDDLRALDWLPEAPAATAGVPETIDGLVVVRDTAAPAPTTGSVDDLVAAARAAKYAARPYPLGLRVDGYWFVPWLRRYGAELAPPRTAADPAAPSIASDGAVTALAAFAALFGKVAAPPPSSGNEAPDELAGGRRTTSRTGSPARGRSARSTTAIASRSPRSTARRAADRCWSSRAARSIRRMAGGSRASWCRCRSRRGSARHSRPSRRAPPRLPLHHRSSTRSTTRCAPRARSRRGR